MRVLAVDFGEKRIGLAVSGTSGDVVVPVGAIARTSDEQAASLVAAAARERDVERIVLGLPVGLDGSEGPAARRVRNFGRRLGRAAGLPVELHGEALTSSEAESRLGAAGAAARRRPGARDAEAAAVLLADYFFARAGRG